MNIKPMFTMIFGVCILFGFELLSITLIDKYGIATEFMWNALEFVAWFPLVVVVIWIIDVLFDYELKFIKREVKNESER